MKRLIRLPEVISITGLSRSSIYAQIKAGKFPAPISIGPRMSAWDSDLIEAWVSERIAESDKGAADRLAVGRRLLEARMRKGARLVTGAATR